MNIIIDLDEIYQICEALFALTLVKKNNFGLDPVIDNAKKYMDQIDAIREERKAKNGSEDK